MDKDDLFALKEYCRKHIEDNSIWRMGLSGQKLPGKIAGTSYAWQFYLRRSLLDVEFRCTIGRLYYYRLFELWYETPFQLAACETAGVPLALCIQDAFYEKGIDLNTYTIRKTPKEYGTRSDFEGIVDPTKPTVLVDDLAGSQTTLMRNEVLLKTYGLKVHDFYLTLVNKVGGKTKPHETYLPGELIYLFDLNDFETTHLGYEAKYGKPPKAWY